MFRAFRYIRGLGVAQSDQAAAFWFYDAAQRGDNAAMVALGLLYAAGRGIPQDWSAAVWWWQRARPTMPLAARLLGDAYACGLGVTPDTDRAVVLDRLLVHRCSR